MKSGEGILLAVLVVAGGAAIYLALKAKGVQPASPEKVGFSATVGSVTKTAAGTLPTPVRKVVNGVVDTTHSAWEKVGSTTGTAGKYAAKVALFPVLGPLSLF